MKQHEKIYVAGHRGLAGSAIVRRLKARGYENLVTRSHSELDLSDAAAVARFFAAEQPQHVFLAAARVGGILANQTYPAEFIHQNLAIQTNLIDQCYRHGVRRLLFLGSSCIYPKHAPQPIQEAHLLTGPLEPTNQAYAVAKIAGIQMCWAYNRQYGTRYIAVMPNNLYGPGDNFNLLTSHVLPALIRKFHLAKLAAHQQWNALDQDARVFGPIPEDVQQSLGLGKAQARPTPGCPEVLLWGSGTPRREFLYSDDLADACVFLMTAAWERLTLQCSDPFEIVFNVGTGTDHTIESLARTAARVVGFDGPIVWDNRMPDGTPRKLLDVTRLKQLGWRPRIDLEEGLRKAYAWYLAQTG
ncbi:MAG: GDP-L-fucose synthase [Desulfobacteraceae bacterium]|nr:MAG: GDP-L-fucose synthase [Desulfobacteraceae bacterium]